LLQGGQDPRLPKRDLVDAESGQVTVRERGEEPVGEEFSPRKVVYAISLKSGKALTTKNLFTFAQVSLLQAARPLRAQGVEVAVVGIPSVGAASGPQP
jgi:uncharacterized protein (TIGR04141 family)